MLNEKLVITGEKRRYKPTSIVPIKFNKTVSC